MTNLYHLVIHCFGGSKSENITTKFVRKVIVRLHELVIKHIEIAYDLFL